MPKKKDLKTTTLSPPTSSVEPWVIEQLSKRPKEAWIRDSYYSKEVLDLKLGALQREINSRFAGLEADADDTQRVVIEQRGKWSKIPKRHEMEDLKVAVTGWSAWFRRMIVGVIVFLIGTGGMAVWQYAVLSAQVGIMERESEKINKENERLKTVQEKLEEKIDLMSNMIQYPPIPPKSQYKEPTGE